MDATVALPPGPRTMRDVPLADLRELRRSPLAFMLAATRRYGDCVRYPLGSIAVYFASHPDHVKHILQDNSRNYSKDTFQYNQLRIVTGEGLLTSDGELWLRQRRLEQPAFHRQRLLDFVPLMAEASTAMLERWEPAVRQRQPIDVAAEMMEVALEIVGRALFSIDLRREAGELAQAVLVLLDHVVWRARTLSVVPQALPTVRNLRFRAALARLDRAVYQMIDDRRRLAAGNQAGPKDLLTMLMAARDDVPINQPTGQPVDQASRSMSDRQLRDEVITLLIAGHETVASALTWTWYLLAQHPAIYRRLSAEVGRVLGSHVPTADDLPALDYTRMVFEEALRLYPPAWIITRRALADDQLGRYRVPAGALVVLSPYVTHRLPAYWTAPEGFDPERFTPEATATRPRFAYFPFGGGPRLCIGNNFAMIEAQMVLAAVVQRYRLDLVPGQDIAPEPSVTLRPKYGLWMRPEPQPGGTS